MVSYGAPIGWQTRTYFNETLTTSPPPGVFGEHKVNNDMGISWAAYISWTVAGRTRIPPETIDFTDPSSWSDDWKAWMIKKAVVPVICLVLGVLVIIKMFIWIECCVFKPKLEKPRLAPLLLTSSSLLFFLVFGSTISVGYCCYAFDLMMYQLDEWIPKLVYLSGQINKTQPELQNTALWLRTWKTDCLSVQTLNNMGTLGENFTSMMDDTLWPMVRNVTFQFYTFQQMTEQLPGILYLLQDVLKYVVEDNAVLFICLGYTPTILITIVVFWLLFIALGDGFEAHSKYAAEHGDLMLKYATCPMMCLSMFVTILGTALLMVTITLGSFCANAPANTVRIISATIGNGNGTSTLAQIAAYYLQNIGWNTLLGILQQVETYIGPVKHMMWAIVPGVNALALTCNTLKNADIGYLLTLLVDTVDNLVPLVQQEYIWSQYQAIVVDGICGKFLESMMMYALLQLFASLVLLPCFAISAHRFLSKAAHVRKNTPTKGQETEMLITKA